MCLTRDPFLPAASGSMLPVGSAVRVALNITAASEAARQAAGSQWVGGGGVGGRVRGEPIQTTCQTIPARSDSVGLDGALAIVFQVSALFYFSGA